jgi:hypothetical protein
MTNFQDKIENFGKICALSKMLISPNLIVNIGATINTIYK